MKESTTWQTEEQKKEHLRFVDEVLTNYFGRSITNNDALATAVYKATDCGARGKVDGMAISFFIPSLKAQTLRLAGP